MVEAGIAVPDQFSDLVRDGLREIQKKRRRD